MKVGDKVKEMTLPEFLQAVGFPSSLSEKDYSGNRSQLEFYAKQFQSIHIA